MSKDEKDDDRRETVEVKGGYSRKCSRCGRVEHAKTRAFHWNEDERCFVASEHEFPRGWSSFYHHVYGNSATPTTFIVAICGDCTPALLEFVKWKRP